MKSTKLFLAFVSLAALLAGCSGPSWIGRSRSEGKRDEDGNQIGLWKVYYDFEHQHPRAQGNYRKDRQDGLWTYWNDAGEPELQTTYAGGRLSGLQLAWHRGGEERSRGFWLAGVENGPWSWWSASGKPEQQGEFLRGKPIGRWSYWNPEGALTAEGLRLDGQRVGPWRFWDAEGKAFGQDWPIPSGWGLVVEAHADGSPKRDGYLRDSKPEGRWTTWHESGARRLSGEFHDGVATGMWYAWRDDGEALAAGRVEGRGPVGEWTAWVDGKTVTLKAEQFAAPDSAQLPGDTSAQNTPVEILIPRWISELSLPATPLAPSASTLAKPPAAVVEPTNARRLGEIKAQPWTANEEENLDYLVKRYTEGTKRTKPPAGGKYGRHAAVESKGDVDRAAAMLGKPLPQTKFVSASGEDVDLDRYKGKRVVLVVLRGYAGMVCVYCATQTKALAGAAAAFAERNAEVLVVYPGPEAGLPAFVEAYKSLSGGLPPPYLQLADADFKLVEPLKLRGDLAIPATLILDENGIVRWAYVGKSVEDRPSTDDMLQALAKLERP